MRHRVSSTRYNGSVPKMIGTTSQDKLIKVDSMTYMTEKMKEESDQEFEQFLARGWDNLSKEEQDDLMSIEQELYDIEHMTTEEYIKKYPDVKKET